LIHAKVADVKVFCHFLRAFAVSFAPQLSSSFMTAPLMPCTRCLRCRPTIFFCGAGGGPSFHSPQRSIIPAVEAIAVTAVQ
jgi:hypothetical protein